MAQNTIKQNKMRQIESNKDVLAVTRSASFNLSYFCLFYSILSHKENI